MGNLLGSHPASSRYLKKKSFFQSQLPEEKTVVSDHIKNQDLNDYRQAEPCVMISFS